MVLLRSSLCKISTAAFHSSRQTQAASLVIPETLLALKTLHGEPFFVPAFMFSYTAAYLTFGSHLFSNAVNSSWAVMRIGRRIFRWAPVGFLGLVCLVGLENAPNTGRLRVFFWKETTMLSTSEIDNQISGRLVQELLDKELIVKDPQDKSFQLVNHVFRNLLEGAVANNGQLLKPFLKDAITADAANSSFGNPSENGSGINTGSKDSGFGKRPFMVYVSKDNGQLAFADGFRNIVIEQDLIRMIGYDEDLVAAMLAHELAHAMQDHVQEKISLKTVFVSVGCVIIGHTWPFVSTLGPFIPFLLPFFLQVLHSPLSKISSRRYEKEADLLSLDLLARSGYDPISAAQLQHLLSESHEHPLLAKATHCMTLCQSKASESKKVDNSGCGSNNSKRRKNGRGREKDLDPIERQDEALRRFAEQRWWESTHPAGRERVAYLLKAMYPIRQAFWANERVRGTPISRFQYQPSLSSMPSLYVGL